MGVQFLCYSKCSTCKKAKTWLVNNNIEFEERPIKEDNPKAVELKEWIIKSGYPIKKFFNTSGNVYKELNLKDKLATMTEGEQLSLLASDGMLVKRPILVKDDVVLVGFKEKEWNTLIKEKL